MTNVQFAIQKVRYGTNGKWFGLKHSDFSVPFSYNKTSDVVVALLVGDDDRVLVENTDYSLDGSMLRLNEEELGLNKDDPLSVSLSVARNTAIPNITFVPGNPVRADDLNDLFSAHQMKIEENTALIKNNTVVSDQKPVNPYTGQHWLQLPFYREFIYTSNGEWVQPQ